MKIGDKVILKIKSSPMIIDWVEEDYKQSSNFWEAIRGIKVKNENRLIRCIYINKKGKIKTKLFRELLLEKYESERL